MNNSILTDIKKLLGISSDYTIYDTDIIMHINSVFMILNQLGVGPTETYQITGSTEKWSDFISDPEKFASVRSYMYLKVKMAFDPSASSVINESYNNLIHELEWRLNVEAEQPSEDV